MGLAAGVVLKRSAPPLDLVDHAAGTALRRRGSGRLGPSGGRRARMSKGSDRRDRSRGRNVAENIAQGIGRHGLDSKTLDYGRKALGGGRRLGRKALDSACGLDDLRDDVLNLAGHRV